MRIMEKFNSLDGTDKLRAVFGAAVVAVVVVVLLGAVFFSAKATNSAKDYRSKLGAYIGKLEAAKDADAQKKALADKPKLKSVPLNFFSSDYKQAKSREYMQSVYDGILAANLNNRDDVSFAVGVVGDISTLYVDAQEAADAASASARDSGDENISAATNRGELGALRLQQKRDELLAGMEIFLRTDTAYRDKVTELKGNPYINDYRDQLLKFADGMINHDKAVIGSARIVTFDGGIVRLQASDELLRKQFLTSKADLEQALAGLWARADEIAKFNIAAMRTTWKADAVPTDQAEALLAAQTTYYADSFASFVPSELGGGQKARIGIVRTNLAILSRDIDRSKASDAVKKDYRDRLGEAGRTVALLPNSDTQQPLVQNLGYFTNNVIDVLDLWQSDAGNAEKEHTAKDMTNEIGAIKQSATQQFDALVPQASLLKAQRAAYVKKFNECFDIMTKSYKNEIHYSDAYLDTATKLREQYDSCKTQLEDHQGAALIARANDYANLSKTAKELLHKVAPR
jgi:hypothetical protein